MTGDCSIFNQVLLPYLPQFYLVFFHMPILTGKFIFHQISKEKSAAYYIRARAIVGQIR